MIKAICFDFDGVLAETFPFHIKAWKKVFKKRGIHVDDNIVYLNEGSPAWQIGRAIAQTAGSILTEDELKDLAKQKNEIFCASNRARVYKGVAEIIERCKLSDIKLALVTGTALANIQAVLSKSLLDEFDEIIKEGDTERGKPHPDPYLKAAEKLGLQSAECLVLENAPLGIRSAKAAGAFCIALMTTLPAEHLKEADVVLENHIAVLDKFDEFLDRAADS